MFQILTITVAVASLVMAKDCEPPPIVDQGGNNATHEASFAEGTHILYFCNLITYGEGYPLYTCVDGQWTNGHSEFVCRWKQCSWPEIEHGTFSAPSFTVGNTATFTCDEGYRIRGHNRAICRIDRKWRGVPTCERIRCPEPGGRSHLRRWQNTRGEEANIYGNFVENSCEEDYKLIGPEVQKCENDGQWTRPDPHCEEIDCGTPDIGSGDIYYDNTKAWSTGILECYDDATLEGEDIIYCFEDGWTYSYCHGACDVPYIEHGQATQGRVTHGGLLHWTCGSGHVKTVSQDIVCRSGNWTVQPECREVEFNLDDSCPATYDSGYYVTRYLNTCYVFINLHIEYELAEKLCRYKYNRLVTIDNEEEAVFLAKATGQLWKERTWLGITWRDDDWRNGDGTRLGYTDWQSGEGGTTWLGKWQKCAVMEPTGRSTWPWDDVKCTNMARVVCEADLDFK